MGTIYLGFEQELARFVKAIKSKKKEESALLEKSERSSAKQAKGHTILFNLWNNYESKLEKRYFEEKVLIIGEFLSSVGENSLAVSHCFMRYFLKFGRSETPFDFVSNGILVEEFRSVYFSSGLEDKTAINTIRALLGISISHSCHVISLDSKLKNTDSAKQLANCLKVIQLSMQLALEREVLCWLVYNGTIHIYTICRQLMVNGHSKIALDYLIWGCISMESSVPLMVTKYLVWRCQLYTAVCHCYFDLNLSLEAENFARRGLNKIQELQEIEQISTSSSNSDTRSIFSATSMKMKIMIFKRNVFESRRRPKGILRPKNKPPLKEISQNPWPRTTTERMLSETFKGRSGQLLAVIESLTDSKRRIAQASLGAPESDDSILDVFAELFFAGCEIIAGGGGSRAQSPGKHESVISDNIEDAQLIELAVKGEDTITISSVVKFVQLAYNYESWETFESLIQPIINFLRPLCGEDRHLIELKSLEVLQALVPMVVSKSRKKVTMGMEEKESSEVISTKHSSARATSFVDDMLRLAKLLESCVTGDKSKIIILGMTDLLVDSCLCLWTKCKSHYSRITSYSMESFKTALQDPHLEKWISILAIAQKTMLIVGLADIDISPCAEASIKIALLLEFICSDNPDTYNERSVEGKRVLGELLVQKKESEAKIAPRDKLETVAMVLGCAPTQWGMLMFAKKLLWEAIGAVNKAKANSYDEQIKIIDDSLRKDGDASTATSVSRDASAVHLELMFVHHRIDCKLSLMKSASKENWKSSKISEQIGMSSSCGKDPLSRAIYMICKAGLINSEANKEECSEILREAMRLLEKTLKMETKLVNDCKQKIDNIAMQQLPPPPVLIYRSATSMVFKPAPFVPLEKEEVYCYKFFLRNASGNNVIVRLSDGQVNGTGIEVINNKSATFTVTGLTPCEMYVAAVAAYNKNGKLIGNGIGSTSSPILASSPLPVGIAYAHLAKAAYNAGSWDLAKRSFNVLWNHFVLETSMYKENSEIKSARESTELNLHRLNMATFEKSSSVLIRYFVQTIFISVDIAVHEGVLFCDLFCDLKPPFPGQTSRLEECRKLLIAMNIAGSLNDQSICLQAVVLCYGLLAPLLQMEVHVKPVLQVFIPCFAALQELQSVIKHRKPSQIAENLQHMLSAITFYIAKVLEKHQQKDGAIRILESGTKMLMGDSPLVVPDSASTSNNTVVGAGPNKKSSKKNTWKKTKAGGKPGTKGPNDSTTSENISGELKVLETYLQKLKRDGEFYNDEDYLELTGVEEVPHVHALLACISSQAGFKEVSKFKRKAQYLEHFVHVLDRALREGLHIQMIDWTKDAVAWLTRRNEVLLNKQAADHRGGNVVVPIVVDDEKNRKFSAAIVEYGKALKVSTSRELLPIAESPRQTVQKEERVESKSAQKQNDKQKNRGKGQSQMTDSERKLKDATQKLQDLLPEFFKMVQRRRRLRSVSHEELPWRSQMNLLMAQCFCDLSKDKYKALVKFHSLVDSQKSSDLMDPHWFSLSTSEALIVSWAGNPKHSDTEIEPVIDIGGQSIEHTGTMTPATLKIDHISNKGKVVLKQKSSTIKPHRRDQDEGIQNTEDPVKAYLAYLHLTLLYLKRSMVLARRGKNWVLLQNGTRKLYNLSNDMHRKIIGLSNGDLLRSQHRLPLNIAKLRELLWPSFYIAADCLLDMLNYTLWNMKEKVDGSSSSLKSSEKLLTGDIRDNDGGPNLEFDPIFDDVSVTGLIWVKRIVWYAIEMLYYEEKWEKVVDLIYRFCALSRDRFGDTLLPILIYAQRRIQDRLHSQSGPPKEQPRLVFDRETGIPIAVYLDPPDAVSIEAGAHIDPEGHNLYNPAVDGLRLVSVPTDVNSNLEKLREVLNSKQYSARALEHCRKLMMLFLAGKQNGMNSKAKLRLGSRVSFVASQVQPQDAVPPDLSQELFEDVEALEKYPLGDNQLAIIISAYDKTIEILKYRKQMGLAAQAMHELGNIMFNSENTRLAYKWWLETLDLILKCKDALKSWRKLLFPDKSIRRSRLLLDRCGIWGCLLGAVLASKIARYIHTLDLGMRSELCQLAAALFQAILCTSLPHPASFIDYASYEIGSKHQVKHLIPGVDLFSNPFRADCSTVVSSLYWTANELVRSGFYFQALPLLTICQYIAVDICKNIRKSVGTKILRIKALAGLNLFSDAVSHLEDIFTGRNLPVIVMGKQSKVIQATQQKFGVFDDSKGITHASNYKVLKELCNVNLVHAAQELYESSICEKIDLAHAHLLCRLANTINDVAEHEVIVSSPSVSTEVTVDHRRIITKSKRAMNKKKAPRSKAGSPSMQSKVDLIAEEANLQSPAKIKGLLLNTVEKIVTRVKSRIEEGKTADEPGDPVRLSAEDLQLFCECEVELAAVADQRLSIITAAKHILNSMKHIEMASIHDDSESNDTLHKLPWSSTRLYTEDSILHADPDVQIDARLWLTLRLQITSLIGSLIKMPVEDQSKSTDDAIGTFEYHVNHGMEEADAFNDRETSCVMKMILIQNSIRCGEDVDQILMDLKTLLDEISSFSAISFDLRLLFFEAKILYYDLQAVNASMSLTLAASTYRGLFQEILNEIIFLGNDINSEKETIIMPLANIYDPLLMHTVALQLRIAKCMTLEVEKASKDSGAQKLLHIDRMLQDSLQMYQKLAKEVPALETEILFIRGLLLRQLFEMEKVELNDVIDAMIDAVRIHRKHTPDLSILRSIYQEIALCYMTFGKRTEENFIKLDKQRQQEESEKENTGGPGTGKAASQVTQVSTKQTLQQQKQMQSKRDKEARARGKYRQSIRKAAWVAVRTAGAIAKAQKKFEYLATESVEASNETVDLVVPDFAVYEILKTDAVVKDDESGCSVNNGVVRIKNRFGKAEMYQFPWSQVITYTRALKKQTSYAGMGFGSSKINLRTAFGVEKHALKLKVMHSFLKESLTIYEKECCPILPTDFLLTQSLIPLQTVPAISVTAEADDSEAKRAEKVTESNVDGAAQKEAEGTTSGRDSSLEVSKVLGKVADRSDRIHSRDPFQASEYEISIQWHRAELSIDNYTTLLFAMNTKATSISDKPASFAGIVTVGSQVISWPVDLHHSLTELFHAAGSELSQTSGPLSKTATAVQAVSTLASMSPTRKKRPLGLKAIPVEQDKEDQLKLQMKGILDRIHRAFDKPESQDVQFEVTLQNISCLETLFNPNYGNISKTNEAFFNWLHYLLLGN